MGPRSAAAEFATLALVITMMGMPALARQTGVPCAGMKNFVLGDSCVTCQGITVKRTRRGLVHGVLVNGRFWTDASAAVYTNAAKQSLAEKTCKDKDPGLRLPTKAEVEALTAALDHVASVRACEGVQDLNAVMPDGAGRHFWSSTANDADPQRSAWSYWGTSNDLRTGPRDGSYSVRCIGEPADARLDALSAAAPVDHEGGAPSVRGPGGNGSREFSSCVTSLTSDSRIDEESAAEACKTRFSPAFVSCVFQLVNSRAQKKKAVDSCLINSSREFATCVLKAAGVLGGKAQSDMSMEAAEDQCLKQMSKSGAGMSAAGSADPGKLDRYMKSCSAGNLLGCVLVAKEKARSGDSAGARDLYKKACDGGFKPGCDGLAGR
jgi:hypothetical protein